VRGDMSPDLDRRAARLHAERDAALATVERVTRELAALYAELAKRYAPGGPAPAHKAKAPEAPPPKRKPTPKRRRSRKAAAAALGNLDAARAAKLERRAARLSDPDALDPVGVARHLGVEPQRVYRWISSGALPADKSGVPYLVKRADLAAFMDQARAADA
jgi:excisionase family DNA binding protein